MSEVVTEAEAHAAKQAAATELKRRRLLEPRLEQLRAIDSQSVQAWADLRDAYETLSAMFDGWRVKIADERTRLKDAALDALQFDGQLREDFLDAYGTFTAEGDPLPSSLVRVLDRFEESDGVVRGDVQRVYRSDNPGSQGWGDNAVTWGVG